MLRLMSFIFNTAFDYLCLIPLSGQYRCLQLIDMTCVRENLLSSFSFSIDSIANMSWMCSILGRVCCCLVHAPLTNYFLHFNLKFYISYLAFFFHSLSVLAFSLDPVDESHVIFLSNLIFDSNIETKYIITLV